MMMTDELIVFVMKRLDEDEATAKAAAPYRGSLDSELAAHNARHDPARVLRQAVNLRFMLMAHMVKSAAYALPSGLAFGCRTCDSRDNEEITPNGYCPTLRLLAGIWSDHPDYRKEWA